MSLREDLINAICSDYDVDKRSTVVKAVDKALADPDNLSTDFQDQVEEIYERYEGEIR